MIAINEHLAMIVILAVLPSLNDVILNKIHRPVKKSPNNSCAGISHPHSTRKITGLKNEINCADFTCLVQEKQF